MANVWRGASVTRLLPTEDAVDLLALTEDVAAREIVLEEEHVIADI